MPPSADLPIQTFATAAAWERWLARHHAGSSGVWLRVAKKGAALRTLTYAEALDVALCHGWIDSQKRACDAESWLQRFSPRGPRSVWSRINVRKVEALLAAGRMRPAGLATVEQAKASGRWDAAYDSARAATVPDDLQAALDASPAAAAVFAALDGANRYAILWRLQTARLASTRARRLAQFVAMLERGERIHGG